MFINGYFWVPCICYSCCIHPCCPALSEDWTHGGQMKKQSSQLNSICIWPSLHSHPSRFSTSQIQSIRYFENQKVELKTKQLYCLSYNNSSILLLSLFIFLKLFLQKKFLINVRSFFIWGCMVRIKDQNLEICKDCKFCLLAVVIGLVQLPPLLHRYLSLKTQSFILGTVLLTHRPGVMSLLLHPFLHYSTLTTICCARVQPTRRSKLQPADCRVMLLGSSYLLLPTSSPASSTTCSSSSGSPWVWSPKHPFLSLSQSWTISPSSLLILPPIPVQMEATICIIITLLCKSCLCRWTCRNLLVG